jgi:hypothetical protein
MPHAASICDDAWYGSQLGFWLGQACDGAAAEAVTSGVIETRTSATAQVEAQRFTSQILSA